MGFTIPDIRKAVAGMSAAGLSDDQSRQIVQYCIKNDNNALRSMIDGDFSRLPSVAASLGIEYGKHTDDHASVNTSDGLTAEKVRTGSAAGQTDGEKLDGIGGGSASADDQEKKTDGRRKGVNTPQHDQQDGHEKKTVKRSAGKKTEKQTAEKTAAKDRNNMDDIKAASSSAARPDGFQDINKEDNADMISGQAVSMDGDIIQCEDVNTQTLPADIPQKINDILSDYMQMIGADDTKKITGRQWHGFCLQVGSFCKNTKILWDHEKIKTQGGNVIYNPDKMQAFFDLWLSVTSAADKTPLPSDFVAFAGVSYDYLQNYNGSQGVSSSQIDLAKKTRAAMQAGLLSHGADGRQNSVFDIFLLKSKFGYVETSQVVHTTAAAALDAAGLPVLGEK